MSNTLYAISILLGILLILDWRQTLVIARNPNKWREVNVILGSHPSVLAVHGYFSVVCVVTAVALVMMPALSSIFFGVGFSILELYWVVHNYRNGIRI